MAWLASAAVAPTMARNSGPIRRTGTPRARATAGSRLANSSGRAMTSSTPIRASAIAVAVAAAAALMPRIDPNSTVTLAVLLPVADPVV